MAEPLPLPDPGLSARAAAVADRLADVLAAGCSDESAGAATAGFLREWAAAASRRPGGPGPLDRLAGAFGLSSDDVELLVLAGLAEEHEGLADTFRALHPAGTPRPTAGLAALVLGQAGTDRRPHVRRLLVQGPLTRARIVRVDGDGPFFERTLVPADGLWPVLHGDDAWPRHPSRVAVPSDQPGYSGWLDRLPTARAVRALVEDRPVTVIVRASDETVGLARCAALVAAAGRRPVGARVPAGDGDAVAGVVLHAVARGAVPVLLPERPADVDAAPGAVLVCAAPGADGPRGHRPALVVDAGDLDGGDRRAAWATALASMPELAAHAADLADRHPVDPALLPGVAADLRDRGGHPGTREVGAVVRARAGAVLPSGSRLRTPVATWDDLVLPGEAESQLRDAVGRLEHAGRVLGDWGLAARTHSGVRVLLSGAPGTGKSLAGEVLARASATDLLVCEVAQVMSKWVGETEKNLSAIFDAAEQTRAVLLLDEADALFGARTAGSDAHDRYLNLHSAYLLQRLDRFDGLAVLTTNLRDLIDAAFLRRLDFAIDLPLPDDAGRKRLWHLHLPQVPGVVGDDVDVELLAALYPVPGAAIRNAAVAAAFAAAAGPGVLSQQHVIDAVRREYAKADRPFPGVPPAGIGKEVP